MRPPQGKFVLRYYRRCRYLFVLLLLVVLIAFGDAFQQPTNNNIRISDSRGITTTTTTTQYAALRKRRKTLPTRSSSSSSQLNVAAAAVPSLFFSSALGSQIGSISILAFVVLIHECGHYIAARLLFRMKVEEFSIGLGPKLLGFRALGNEFNLRALPLGGYVRFPMNYNTTLKEEVEVKRAIKQYKKINSELEENNNNELLKRRIVNILTLGLYEEQMNYLISKEKEKEKDKNDNKTSDKKQLFFWRKQKNIKKKMDEEDSETNNDSYYFDDPDLLQNRPWPQRAVVIAGGVIFNILLAFGLFFGIFASPSGMNIPNFDAGARVSVMPAVTAPVSGLLAKEDIILAVNGIPLTSSSSNIDSSPFYSLSQSQQGIADFIQTIRQTPDGESIQLKVLRKEGLTNNNDNNIVDITVKPKRANAEAPLSIGAVLSPNYIGTKPVRGETTAEAAQLALQYVQELLLGTATGLSEALKGVISSKGGAGPQFSGPVGLIRSGSEVVASSTSIATVSIFAATISINLAVMNSLPLPALDGGQMVFILAEAVSGRKVDQGLEESITGYAVLLLVLIAFSTTIGDIQNIFSK